MSPILLLEDDPIMGESLVQRLELEGMSVVWCRQLDEAGRWLQTRQPAAVISDVRLPDGLATQWYLGLPAAQRALPWFFLTGYGSVNDAVAAVRAGAREYLTKPFDIEQLVALIRGATAPIANDDDETLLGVSAAMRRVESMVRKVAVQRVAVLVTGESGVGKEVVAQLIHRLDPRPDKGEFVAVNCAAIPEQLLEAEFFGYEKGAFSGAVRAHKGYLERADRGTLFLDEVAELPANMQAKLLRALQEKCFFPLGGERARHSNFRVIAATNRNLVASMEAGDFREDLFYRLAVVKIDIPPLRERPEDIRWLAEKFLAQLVLEQERPLAVSDAFLRDLMARPWRGNARELRAYLEEAVILSDGGVLDAGAPWSGFDAGGGEASADGVLPLQRVVEAAERAHIQKALRQCQGSVGKTAELLGISRKTLWEKMKKLGIQA
jgi:DNA-binding NtrC family response regulator